MTGSRLRLRDNVTIAVLAVPAGIVAAAFGLLRFVDRVLGRD